MSKKEKEYDPARASRRFRNFIVAVVAAVIAWFAASNVYVEMRAANAFDELYYSTLDARSGKALFRGHASPTVLASALSAYKSEKPHNEWLETGYRMGDVSDAIGNNENIYGFMYDAEYIPGLDGVTRLYWYIEDESEEGRSLSSYSGKCVVFCARVSPESLGGHPDFGKYPDTYGCTWVYDVDSKELSLYSVDSPIDYDDMRTDYDEEVFKVDGADPLLMVERSRQAIRDVVLRDYLEGARFPEDEVESKLAAMDPIIDDAVQRARSIYQNGEDE